MLIFACAIDAAHPKFYDRRHHFLEKKSAVNATVVGAVRIIWMQHWIRLAFGVQ